MSQHLGPRQISRISQEWRAWSKGGPVHPSPPRPRRRRQRPSAEETQLSLPLIITPSDNQSGEHGQHDAQSMTKGILEVPQGGFILHLIQDTFDTLDARVYNNSDTLCFNRQGQTRHIWYSTQSPDNPDFERAAQALLRQYMQPDHLIFWDNPQLYFWATQPEALAPKA